VNLKFSIHGGILPGRIDKLAVDLRLATEELILRIKALEKLGVISATETVNRIFKAVAEE
jgi:hypothetical protein